MTLSTSEFDSGDTRVSQKTLRKMAVSFKDFNTFDSKSHSNMNLLSDSIDGLEEKKIPRWRIKWMLRLTNVYYNAALDMLNLLLTMYIVVFDIHMRNTYIYWKGTYVFSLIV